MSEGTLYTALLAAQKAMGPVKKDASNPAFRTKYATLQSVLETIDGPLNDNGLVLVQRLQYDRIGRDGGAGESTPILITELIHAASGDKLDSHVPVVCKDPTDPQKVGGALTYYRRYSLLALLGLAPEDDDGHAASQPARRDTAHPPPAFTRPREEVAVATLTLAQVEAEIAPLEKQVRRNDDALSNAEYARYHALDARRKELRPAPAKGEPPASVAPKPVAPPVPFTPNDFGQLIDRLWQLAEDGAALARIKDELNGSRHRMTREMMDEARLALAKIEAKYYAPAGIAG